MFNLQERDSGYSKASAEEEPELEVPNGSSKGRELEVTNGSSKTMGLAKGRRISRVLQSRVF